MDLMVESSLEAVVSGLEAYKARLSLNVSVPADQMSATASAGSVVLSTQIVLSTLIEAERIVEQLLRLTDEELTELTGMGPTVWASQPSLSSLSSHSTVPSVQSSAIRTSEGTADATALTIGLVMGAVVLMGAILFFARRRQKRRRSQPSPSARVVQVEPIHDASDGHQQEGPSALTCQTHRSCAPASPASQTSCASSPSSASGPARQQQQTLHPCESAPNVALMHQKGGSNRLLPPIERTPQTPPMALHPPHRPVPPLPAANTTSSVLSAAPGAARVLPHSVPLPPVASSPQANNPAPTPLRTSCSVSHRPSPSAPATFGCAAAAGQPARTLPPPSAPACQPTQTALCAPPLPQRGSLARPPAGPPTFLRAQPAAGVQPAPLASANGYVPPAALVVPRGRTPTP